MPKSSSDTDDEQTEKDTTAAEKKKLLRQIRELNSIIEQCKWSLETLRFKDVERRLKDEPASLKVPSSLKNLPNVDVELQNDFYRFAGLNCVNVHRNEVTFNFVSDSSEEEKHKYAVQLFIKDGKVHLGKWVMPMSINMNEIMTTPIDLKNLNPFVRTCKHYVDCYTVRQQQFLSLKKHISNMQHCNLQSDMGYTVITLELYGVHDRENDKYINIVVYLQYHSDRTRPHKIKVETNDKNVLSDDAKQRLKVCLKEFKLSDLPTAFDRVLVNDSEFTWMRTDDSDSPLELHYSSDSDEGFLAQFQSERKKSSRQAKKKKELRKKWSERKRQRYTASKITTSDCDDDDDDLEVNEPHTENSKTNSRRGKKRQASKDNDSDTNAIPYTKNPREILKRNKKKEAYKDNNSEANKSRIKDKSLRSGKKRKEASRDNSEADISLTENSRANLRKEKKQIVSILKQQQSIGKNLLEDDTPKVKNKLKQTKLNFQANSVTPSGSAENSIFSLNLRNRPDNKKTTLITSTPLDRGRTSKTSYLETINITDIEKPKKTTNVKKNSEPRNLRSQKNIKTPRKSLRSKLPSKSVFL